MSAKLAGKRKRGSAAYPIVINGGPSPKRMRARAPVYRGGYAQAGELKFLDTTVDDAIIAAGGVVTATVNVIVQGVGESNRVGRKCTLKSIFWRGSLAIPLLELEGSPGSSERFRLILYLDKQANGATAAALDILEAVTVDDYRNLANSGRFQVLYDHHLVLNYETLSHFAVNSFSMAQVKNNFSFFKKCNIPLEFSGANGTIDEIRSNNIGLLVVSEGGSGALVSRIRIRFSDH